MNDTPFQTVLEVAVAYGFLTRAQADLVASRKAGGDSREIESILMEDGLLPAGEIETLAGMVRDHLSGALVSATQFQEPNRRIHLEPGATFGGYEILGQIARGAMGVVYRARQPKLRRVVALKVLAPSSLGDPVAAARRFRSEARLAARLCHPNLVPVFDLGTAEGFHYFAMDFVEGQTLDRLVREKGALDPREAVGLLIPVIDAIHYAHVNGCLHRDLKLANILTDTSGIPKVADFGLGRDDRRIDRANVGAERILGTLGYAAPEQYGVTDDPVDNRADVYSLGVCLFHLLTARLPFSGEDYARMTKERRWEDPPRLAWMGGPKDARLDAILHRAMAPRPADRYSDARNFAEELRQWLAGSRSGLVGRRVRPAHVVAGLSLALAVASSLVAVRERSISRSSAQERLAAPETTKEAPSEPRTRGELRERALALAADAEAALARSLTQIDGEAGLAALQESRRLAESALALSGDLASARRVRGLARGLSGDRIGAYEDLLAAAVLSPDDARIVLECSLAASRAGFPELARRSLAHSTPPNDPELARERVRALVEAGEFAGAVEFARTLQARGAAEDRLVLGEALLAAILAGAAGVERESALEEIRRICSEAPRKVSGADALLPAARLALAVERSDIAGAALDRLRERIVWSDRPGYHLLRARTSSLRGDLPGALDELRRTLELEPAFAEDPDPELREIEGDILARLGRTDEARAARLSALDLWRRRLGAAQGAREALRAIERIEKEVPSPPGGPDGG